MTNLPELLARLAEWPEVCQRKEWRETLDTYHIGDYVFWFVQGDLRAHSETSGSSDFIQGQPAHAWLLDSLMQACEGKGFKRIHIHYNGVVWHCQLLRLTSDYQEYDSGHDTLLEALMIAFITALESK